MTKIVRLPRKPRKSGPSKAISRKDYMNLKTLMDSPRDRLLLSLMALCIRIGDVLNIKVKDCYDAKMVPRTQAHITEGKTNKPRLIDLSPIQVPLNTYAAEAKRLNLQPDDVLFWSKKGPLRRQSVNRILEQHRQTLGLEQLSPHSLRKYQARYLILEVGIPITVISKMLNHSHVKITEIYADIQQSDVQHAYDNMAV